MQIKLFFKCLFSPSLYSYKADNPAWGKYDPNDWERWGDNLVVSMILFGNLGLYTSPVLIYLMFRKGYFTSVTGAYSLMKLSVGLGVIVGATYCIRSYGRAQNGIYKTFLTTLDNASRSWNNETKSQLKKYDFEFSAWPVEFVNESGVREERTDRKRSWAQSPCLLVSYLVCHTFGIRLIYPGSIRAINFLLGSALLQGRTKLLEIPSSERFKLRTYDSNEIDVMFVDRRKQGGNGSTLVICSEGNAGFYEIGIMATPLANGYSVLGWNHPGFGGSTGVPYPSQEHNAVDTVMQFALNKLGFKPENVVLFGWSIGGYSSAWAAKHYPDVKAVILDATFDDILPLAIPRMPELLEPIVKLTIRNQANLDIARLLTQYPGPIHLIRRSEDEVICVEPNMLSTNRGNHLLVKLLRARHPHLFEAESTIALQEWLSVSGNNQMSVYDSVKVDNQECKQILDSYYTVYDPTFPTTIGQGLDSSSRKQLLLYIASRYLDDYNSTHCTPLPNVMFFVPSEPW